MATTYNFMNGSVQGSRSVVQPVLEPGVITPIRAYIDFTQQTIDAGEGDIAQVIQIPAGTWVMDCFMRVITAETADATCSLGYGDDADYWGRALNLDATGVAKTLLTASDTWDAGSIATAPAMLSGTATWDAGSIADGDEEAKEITVTGAALGMRVIVTPSIDLADLTLTAAVTASNTVTAVLANNTGGAIDLASMTITAYAITGSSEEAKDFTVVGASLGDKVTAIPSIDITDLTLSASVTAEDTVTVVLSNTTGAAVDLASMTMTVIVDKSNLKASPLYFASTDTIDITATTTNGDVDIDGAQVEVIATCLRYNYA